jgi:hypothetical protein
MSLAGEPTEAVEEAMITFLRTLAAAQNRSAFCSLRYSALLLIILTAEAYGQVSSVKANSAPSIPPALKLKLEALGDRFSAQGKERLTLTGTIQRPTATGASINVIYENGRKFRYEEAGKVLTYDGSASSLTASTAAADQGLFESLFEDSVDGLFFSAQNAPFFRPLMNRARLDDGKAKAYSGPFVDIYQFVLPVSSLPKAPKRIKHFYFNSNTQLLDRVRYFGDSNEQVQVETQFQKWQATNGTFAPTVITRSENGVTQFTVNATSVSVGPAQKDNTFSQP